DAERHPPYLTMALGAGSVTMWQLARAYSVFANGGYLVQPYFIHKIVDDRGNVLALAEPRRAGDEALRVIAARNAFILANMRQDVPEMAREMPIGVVVVPPGPFAAGPGDTRLVPEYFYQEAVPPPEVLRPEPPPQPPAPPAAEPAPQPVPAPQPPA